MGGEVMGGEEGRGRRERRKGGEGYTDHTLYEQCV
jgi:hypothetical protein